MRALLVGVLAATVACAGCDAVLGIQDDQLAPVQEGGVSSDGSIAVDASRDGSPGDTGTGGDAGTDGDAEVDATGPGNDSGEDASDAPVGCAAGALQCSGNTPQQCIAGTWQNQAPCGGSTPVCSGGVCGTYRATGGIRSTAPSTATDSGIQLVSGGFELGARSCNTQGLCFSGGIVP